MMEPSADVRVMANHLRQLFVALIYEGFTEPQALQLLGNVLSVNVEED